jgi:hypothetical protein
MEVLKNNATAITYDDESILVESDYKAITNLSQRIYQQLKDCQSNIDKLIPEIRRLEKQTESFPRLFVREISEIIYHLSLCRTNENIIKFERNLVAKAVSIQLEKSNLSILDMIESQKYQIKIFLLQKYYPYEKTNFNDYNPITRKKYSERLLEIYQNIVLRIDEQYDFEASENQIINNSFEPPESYKGIYFYGMDMSNDEDETTRIAYKNYLEDQKHKVNKRMEQQESRNIKERFEKKIQTYIINVYSLFPYRTAELEKMLKEKKVDSEMSQTILDAVRKHERENPDEGFRIWLSKDKLFKTEAKMISADKDNVTIKDKQGRQSTIELSALRQEDQDYVKRQRELKTKTSP